MDGRRTPAFLVSSPSTPIYWFAGIVGLTLFSLSRRPSGQPIEEESGPEPPRESPAEVEDENRSPQPWAYSALGDDNVWGK